METQAGDSSGEGKWSETRGGILFRKKKGSHETKKGTKLTVVRQFHVSFLLWSCYFPTESLKKISDGFARRTWSTALHTSHWVKDPPLSNTWPMKQCFLLFFSFSNCNKLRQSERIRKNSELDIFGHIWIYQIDSGENNKAQCTNHNVTKPEAKLTPWVIGAEGKLKRKFKKKKPHKRQDIFKKRQETDLTTVIYFYAKWHNYGNYT